MYTVGMITKGMVEQDLIQRDLESSVVDLNRFTKFINAYYKEMQLWGVYLSDLSYRELNSNAQDNFFDSAYKLWKTQNQ